MTCICFVVRIHDAILTKCLNFEKLTCHSLFKLLVSIQVLMYVVCISESLCKELFLMIFAY